MQIKPLYLVMAAAAALVFAPMLDMAPASAGDLNKQIPAPLSDPANTADREVAVLAGGCFWGQQGVFAHVKGVTKVVSGYSGGARETADYDQVSSGRTGHAESVQITFNPKEVSFGTLLRIYFSVAHDPTEVNRQGPDHGTQYRTEIFASTPQQEATAKAYIAQLEAAKIFDKPIATKVGPLKAFYAAEDYHQDYLFENPDSAYIRVNDLPKIAALERVWPQYFRGKPVLFAANAAGSRN